MTSKITVQLLAIKPLSLYSLLVLVELFCESMKFRIKPRTWGASLHRFMGPVLWHSLLFLLYSVSSCLSNSSLWCFLYSVKMLITYWDPLLFAAVWTKVNVELYLCVLPFSKDGHLVLKSTPSVRNELLYAFFSSWRISPYIIKISWL